MKPVTGTPSFVRLAGTVSPAELRTETYDGREVIVVPVIALLGDVVVKGLTTDGPNFIPSSVLAAAPETWNGRPVLLAHPSNGTTTANTPHTWQSESLGQIWNAEFSDNRLRMEIWLDPVRAEAIGGEALEVLAKVQAGEMFEVSTGSWVWLTEQSGVAPDGKSYDYVWSTVPIPDHLAISLGLHGGKGACDIEMGCGGMRTMSAAQAIAAKETKPMDFLSALLKQADIATLAQDMGMSTNELMTKLSKSLRATVPGFSYISDVYPDSSTMIYSAMPGDSMEWYRCKYDASGEEATTSLHKRVEPTMTYKPVTNSQADEAADAPAVPALSANCKCQHAQPDQPAQGQAHQGKGDAMKKSELAGRLIANAAAPFAEADRATLEALSEDQLTAMDKSFTPPAEPEKKGDEEKGKGEPAPKPVPEPKPAPADTVQLSRADHTALVRLASREVAREKETHANLSKLLLAASPAFTAEQLAQKGSDELVQLCTLAGIDVSPTALDYSGRGAHAVTALADDTTNHTPPDPWKVPAALAASLGLTTTAQ